MALSSFLFLFHFGEKKKNRPTELDQDHIHVITMANDGQGCVTIDDIMQHLSWTKDRAERAITLLLQEGMAWRDDYHGISFYWFPSVWKEQLQNQLM